MLVTAATFVTLVLCVYVMGIATRSLVEAPAFNYPTVISCYLAFLISCELRPVGVN